MGNDTITQDEAVKAVDLMIRSLNNQAEKFPQDQTFLVSREIAQHLSDYAANILGLPSKFMFSGDSFQWKGFKCRVA
jgi:hypothetical protein